MTDDRPIVVFVHGWSVTSVETYGGLPRRLAAAASAGGLDLSVEHIYLGRYISFRDEVRLPDISRAFHTAAADQLTDALAGGRRFVCITHSTGGPVIRDWWHRYYASVPRSGKCPMSHLIMLAPANFGSALAQLGKGRVGRLKSWSGGVEPGQGVLDWLELGSEESWKLNRSWILSDGGQISAAGVFPFVLTGQKIDRSVYDHLNSYTGEPGSDGVVRVAAANLNARYMRLEQQRPERTPPGRRWVAKVLELAESVPSPETAFRVVRKQSHSGKNHGIMRSVNASTGQDVVDCILRCIRVRTRPQYMALADDFAMETEAVQKDEQLEIAKGPLRRRRVFIHDRYSMVTFLVRDHQDYPVTDFDLVLTAGPGNSPDHLPAGFFVDRQRNSISSNVVTYYFNHDAMTPSPKVSLGDEVLRPELPGADRLGLKVVPRPKSGFVHYLPCQITATADLLAETLRPNSTTLVEVVLHRIVRRNTFRVDAMIDIEDDAFGKTRPGPNIAD